MFTFTLSRRSSASRQFIAVLLAAFVVLQFLVFAAVPTAAQKRAGALNAPLPLAPSTTVVISQAYGGGGNAGSTFRNDFIELFNRGTTPQSLTGWAVQYASATGTTWAVTNLTNVTLQPGQYYLVQEAQGAGGTTSLPTPDAIGTIAMAATAGKVVLTNTTTPLVGACPTGGSIVDFVGFGTTANCFEGTGPTPAPSNTTAVIRGGNGCTETDQNATDFTAAAPNPRNTVTTFAPCGGGGTTTLSINDVTQTEGNAGTSVFTFTVTLSAAAPAAGVTFDIATADGTAQDGNPVGEDNDYVAKSETGRTIAAGGTSATFTVTVNGDTTTEPNETFFVNVTNVTGATVSDGQGLGTITNDEVTITPIYVIQGSGSTSPLVTQSVTTSGIVTGTKSGSSGGFFIQDPSGDGNPNTSDGVFVFTGASLPAGAVVGNSVQVTGTVQEFIPSADLNQKPLTELSGTITVNVLSTGNPLPAPVTIMAADTLVNNLENLERFEGMRVSVASLTVVAPTQGTINEPNATVTSNGVFYGVVTGVARPFREPGVSISDTLPVGSPANVPRFDENPERLRVDSDAQPGTTAVNVSVGSVFTSVVGEMDYAFRTWTILPEQTLTGGTNGSATPAPAPNANELTVASFNMERFFDTVDDPGTSDPVLTATAFNNRLNKASLIIRNVQHYPDVIGVEEMEHLSTLQAVAAKVNSDAQTIDLLPNPNYVAYLVEGNDIGGIDVGFLVKESRVSTTSVTQIELAGCDHVTASTCYNYTNPNNSQLDILNDRPPLVLVATAPRPAGGTFNFTVIVNHLRSLSGVDDPVDGNRVRTKRRAQAEFLANLIQSRQTADATERIITVGDMNAFNISDGYVDVMGTVKGTPAPPDQVVLASADLVNPDQTNLVDTLPADQRYSYSFDGNAQVLDQILVNPPALAQLNRFAYARDDADQPVADYGVPTVPDRISDHDQPIAYFSLGGLAAGSVIISEFRFHGITFSAPNDGFLDEYVELYNNTNQAITVTAADNSAGWALAYTDGSGTSVTVAVVIPNNTVIPARGHYLLTNETGGIVFKQPPARPTGIIPSGAYSLTPYAPTDLTYGEGAGGSRNDIPDNGAIAVFQTANPASFSLSNRLDAVSLNNATGATADLFREGTNLPSPGPNDGQYAYVRKLTTGIPQDTDNNAQDFSFVSTNAGSYGGVQSQLGAPGPENSISPIQRNATIKAQLIEPQVSSNVAPNRVRNLTPVTNGAQGTLDIRRHFVNNTGGTVTRLRFRIVDITTLNSPGYVPGGSQADIRAIDGSNFAITTSRGSLTVMGTTVEQPFPLTQPNGGGLNSSVTVAIPGGAIAPGAAIDVHFLLGVQQGGSYRFFINVEALP